MPLSASALLPSAEQRPHQHRPRGHSARCAPFPDTTAEDNLDLPADTTGFNRGLRPAEALGRKQLIRVRPWNLADNHDGANTRHVIGHTPRSICSRMAAARSEVWPMTSLVGPYNPPALTVMFGALATPLSS